ncbi:MAG: flagellin [Alphaproteobacteria bacterium]|jgi:flagellin|nr:flagellin [Alphaproteobacteria bacterium]MDP6515566.1 flagellin [Alphaproteobacteria bacterium]|tara:strand:- start:656 stop:1483 length:828 start_codon:yes stop_codon:yes gene_type:complete
MAVTNSINTNVGAMVALRALNATNVELEATQERISTGLKVVGAADNASSFAIAQGLRAEIKSIAAVQQGLSNGRGVATVALAGATEISNLLGDIKEKVTEGLNAANTTAQQTILNADFSGLVDQILTFVQNAEFNGRNIIESGGSNLAVLSDVSGGALTVRAQDLEGTAFSPLNAQNIANVTAASAALTVVNSVIATVNTALGQLGSDARALELQDNFTIAINDALEEGLANIVDADLAKESAQLTALLVKQQLGVQVLGIANSSPSVLLALFVA